MDLALNNLQRLIYHKTQPTIDPTVDPLTRLCMALADTLNS